MVAFSDHILLPWSVDKSYVRASFDKHEEYIKSINALKNKYRRKIKILLAYECEYHPGFVEYYSNLLNTKTVDFLIFGNHYPNYDFHSGKFINSQ